MDILVRGGGFENKGAEAMLRTVQEELGRRLENVRFCIRVPEDGVHLVENAGFHPLCSRGGKMRKLGTLLMSFLLDHRVLRAATAGPRAAAQVRDLRNISAIIDISGFSYSDVWGHESSKLASVLVEFLARLGRPYFFMPQAWGPFAKPLVAKYARRLCQKATLIYARDQKSYDYLMELTGEDKASVRIAPDIAFRFKAADQCVGSEVLSDIGVESGRDPIVGLVPNMRIYERMSGSGINNAYVTTMTDIAEHCINKLGAIVVLIPHEIACHSQHSDDRYLCGLIRTVLEDRGAEPARALVGRYSAEVIKSVIGQLDLLVASRYHSLVAALSSHVPAVALGWSHKYVELMQLAGLRDCVLDYSQLDCSSLLDKVSAAWDRREGHKRILEQRLLTIQRDVDTVFDRVAELIQASF